MEWRCFIPILDGEECNTAIRQQYNDIVNRLQSSFIARLDGDNETRTDEYFIGADYCGLKHRAGKKLEVKLRSRSAFTFPGIEEWEKYKLSKKHYMEEYADLLNSHNFPADEALVRSEKVNVLKVRRRNGYSTGKEEMTSCYPDYETAARTKRTWMSICFESNTEAGLVSLLRSANCADLLCECLTMAMQIHFSDIEWARRMLFFPVLSGYPAWVHCLSSPGHASSAELMRSLLLFLEEMRRPAPPLLPERLFTSESDEVISRYVLHEESGSSSRDISSTQPDGDSSNTEPTWKETLFDFSSFPTLTTPRLRLREVTLQDAADVFLFRGDYEVTKYNCGDAYADVAQVEKLIRSQDEQFAAKEALRFGLSLLSSENGGQAPVVGMVGFNYWDRTDRRASIGLELRQSLWGQGFMSEALRAVLRFGFEEMGLNRIEALASVYNDTCITLLKRLGFVHEGTQREQYYEHGAYHDVVLYALLKREWNDSTADTR